MERQIADKLVKKLGMEIELAPLLDSDESYTRFEGAISGILNRLKGTCPRIIIDKQAYYESEKLANSFYGTPATPARWDITPKFVTTTRFDEALECFQRKYGIGVAEQSEDLIAQQLGLARRGMYKSHGIDMEILRRSGQSAKEAEKIVRSHYSTKPGVALVRQKVTFAAEVLKQQHKKEIWYNTL